MYYPVELTENCQGKVYLLTKKFNFETLLIGYTHMINAGIKLLIDTRF
jgi:hypothetical protein